MEVEMNVNLHGRHYLKKKKTFCKR